MPCAVRGMAGAPDRFACFVVGVPAERTLRDLALGSPVERKPHVLQLEHRLDGFIGHELDGILVAEIIGPLDRIIGVPLGFVFLVISQRRTDAALRRARMGTCRVELADDCRLCPARSIQSRHQSRAPRPDDNYFKLMNICHIAPDETRRALRTLRSKDESVLPLCPLCPWCLKCFTKSKGCKAR